MYGDTVRSEIRKPSFKSSPWMRGAPHRFSLTMRAMSSRPVGRYEDVLAGERSVASTHDTLVGARRRRSWAGRSPALSASPARDRAGQPRRADRRGAVAAGDDHTSRWRVAGATRDFQIFEHERLTRPRQETHSPQVELQQKQHARRMRTVGRDGKLTVGRSLAEIGSDGLLAKHRRTTSDGHRYTKSRGSQHDRRHIADDRDEESLRRDRYPRVEADPVVDSGLIYVERVQQPANEGSRPSRPPGATAAVYRHAPAGAGEGRAADANDA